MVYKYCAYGILEKDDKYLLVLSSDSHKWNLPGGRLTSKESGKKNEGSIKRVSKLLNGTLDAVVRETFEEVNLEVKVLDNMPLKEKIYSVSNDDVKHKFFYSIEAVGGEISPSSEVIDANYLTLKEIRSMHKKGDLKKGVYSAIKEYKKHYQ